MQSWWPHLLLHMDIESCLEFPLVLVPLLQLGISLLPMAHKTLGGCSWTSKRVGRHWPTWPDDIKPSVLEASGLMCSLPQVITIKLILVEQVLYVKHCSTCFTHSSFTLYTTARGIYDPYSYFPDGEKLKMWGNSPKSWWSNGFELSSYPLHYTTCFIMDPALISPT